MKIPLDKSGIRTIRHLCEQRVAALNRASAYHASVYLSSFGYHAFFAPKPFDSMPGWTCYYAANWNCSVNAADRSVISPERDPFNGEEGEYLGDTDQERGWSVIAKAQYGEVIYVTNSVYYEKWLNDGGVEFLTFHNNSHPNRFIELCEEYLRGKMKSIIIAVKKGDF